MAATYRRNAVTAVLLEPDRSAAFAAGTTHGRFVLRSALEILSECSEFRTLEEHAIRIARARNLHAAEIRAVLGQLLENKYLEPKTAFLSQVVAMNSRTDGVAPPIRAIAITTRMRPGAVRRCIQSYVSALNRYGRSPTWTVLDSSINADARDRCEGEVDALVRSGVAVRVAARPEKSAFSAALAREAGVDPELVNFALFGIEALNHDTGANHNALLLAHAGEMFVTVDDDTLGDMCGPVAPTEEIEIASFRMPDVTLFESLQHARATLSATATDILGAHETALGRTLGDHLDGRADHKVIVDRMTDATMQMLRTSPASVAVTVGGFWGDCASTTTAFHLFCAGARPDALPLNADAYRAIVASRQLLRAPSHTAIAHATNVMGTNLGTDARALLPPFFPVRRASDLIFGSLLSRCFDGRMFGLLPQAVCHVPIEPRSANPDALWGTAKPKLASVLFTAIQLGFLELAAPAEARLRLLGRHLIDLGSLPWADFEQVLLPRLRLELAGMMRTIRSRLNAAEPSSPWSRDARSYYTALATSLVDGDLVLPESLRDRRSTEEARALMLQLFRRFGALLEAWPDLFAAAVRLRAKGITLAPARVGTRH